MSALDRLSVASNVVQVLGFTDQVFRTGKALYDLVDKARNASRNIGRLLSELQALLHVVAFVYVVIDEHASSPFAQDDGHTLPNIRTILTLIEHDFLHLRGLIEQYLHSSREGWLSLLQGNVRWAMNDHDIEAARHRLAQYTSNLNAALSVVGRRNDVVLRTKLQNIEDKLQAISHVHPLQAPSNRAITQQAVRIAPVPISRRQIRITGTRSQSRGVRSGVARRNAPLHAIAPTIATIPPRTTNINNPITQSIDRDCPKINIYEQVDRTLLLDTGNYSLQQITKSAVFLRDVLITSLASLCANSADRISKPQVDHLQRLFDFLTAAAHTASAETIGNKYNTDIGAKSLNHIPPTSRRKGMKVRAKKEEANVIANSSFPVYLEETCLKLETIVGLLNARLLSARSLVEYKTLAFIFQYHGNKKIGLLPFEVDFISHAPIKTSSKIGHVGFLDMAQSILSTLVNMRAGAADVSEFVFDKVSRWGDKEMTVLMTCGQRLPRMPIKVDEFSRRTHITSTIIPRAQDLNKNPPLGMIYIDHRDEPKYGHYIDYIIDHNLETFGETCWMEDDNDFLEALFKAMIRVQPKKDNQAKLLREAYRLVIVTYIMGHVISIAEENKMSTLSQMQSCADKDADTGKPIYSRLANKQLKYSFSRLQRSIITSLMLRLEKVLMASDGCHDWVPAFIAVLSLAMASEEQQKTIHFAGISATLMGVMNVRSAQKMEQKACSNIDSHFDFIAQTFRWRYNRKFNPLRDAHLDWDREAGFEDQNSVDFVKNVANLVKSRIDFLQSRAKVTVPTGNITQYTARLVAKFLISFWLPE